MLLQHLLITALKPRCWITFRLWCRSWFHCSYPLLTAELPPIDTVLPHYDCSATPYWLQSYPLLTADTLYWPKCMVDWCYLGVHGRLLLCLSKSSSYKFWLVVIFGKPLGEGSTVVWRTHIWIIFFVLGSNLVMWHLPGRHLPGKACYEICKEHKTHKHHLHTDSDTCTTASIHMLRSSDTSVSKLYFFGLDFGPFLTLGNLPTRTRL